MSYGFNGYVGMAKESGWGSGVAATDFVEALTEDMAATLDRFSHKAIIGTSAEPDSSVGLRHIAGRIRAGAHPVSMGHFLKGALGTKSLTVVLSGFLFKNEFFSTAVNADFSTEVPLQPYTLEMGMDVTTAVRFTGCVVDALTMTFDTAGAVMVEAAYIGRGSSVASLQTPTFPSSPSKPFTFDTVSLSLAGIGTSLIESLEVMVNNNLQGIGALNLSTDIAKIRRTNHQMVTLRGTIDFTDLNEYNRFLNQTEMQLLVSATRQNSFQLVVDIPRMVYTAFPLNNPGAQRLTANFEGKGFYHQGSATAIRIALTTINSTY